MIVNGAAGARSRSARTAEAQNEFPVVRQMAEAFGNADTVRAIEKATGTDLSIGQLRMSTASTPTGSGWNRIPTSR